MLEAYTNEIISKLNAAATQDSTLSTQISNIKTLLQRHPTKKQKLDSGTQ
jgi:hypothetical protein